MEATLKLIRHRLDGVTIHRDFATDRLAKAPAGPMNQVLLNLVDNAVRMGAKNLWVSIHAEESSLVVKVGDDGPGVPKTMCDRIFDPFFTHRPESDGTGLGSLSVPEDGRGRRWIAAVSKTDPAAVRCSSWWFLRYPWNRSRGGRRTQVE